MASAVEKAVRAPAPEAPQAPAPAPGLTRARRARALGLLEGRGWTLACLGSDALMLLLAVGAAFVGADAAGVDTGGSLGVVAFPPLVVALLALRGTYRSKIQERLLDAAARVVSATSFAAMCIIAVAAFAEPASQFPSLMARVWLFAAIYVAGGRFLLLASQRHARASRSIGKPTLIIGAGQVAAQLERRLDEQPELGLRPVGYVDANPAPAGLVPDRRAPVLGAPVNLPRIAAETGAQHVILAFLYSRGSDARLIPVIRQCEELGLEISLVPRLFDVVNERVELEHIGGLPLVRLHWVNPKGWQFAIKHALDRVAAALLLILLAPVLLASAAGVRLSSPGAIFFRQRRVGRDGRPFDLLKFRSMRPAEPGSEKVTALLPRDTAPGGVEGADRRTRVGRLLRRTSLDELPQLINVLRGEMSIVGPRPERPEFVHEFERQVRRYDERHRVRAGITGWAQVHGLRGNTSLSDRIEWDNFYIENWSLWLDLKILLMTLVAVFRQAE